MRVTVVERSAGQRSSGPPVDVRGPAADVADRMSITRRLHEAQTDVGGMRFVTAQARWPHGWIWRRCGEGRAARATANSRAGRSPPSWQSAAAATRNSSTTTRSSSSRRTQTASTWWSQAACGGALTSLSVPMASTRAFGASGTSRVIIVWSYASPFPCEAGIVKASVNCLTFGPRVMRNPRAVEGGEVERDGVGLEPRWNPRRLSQRCTFVRCSPTRCNNRRLQVDLPMGLAPGLHGRDLQPQGASRQGAEYDALMQVSYDRASCGRRLRSTTDSWRS